MKKFLWDKINLICESYIHTFYPKIRHIRGTTYLLERIKYLNLLSYKKLYDWKSKYRRINLSEKINSLPKNTQISISSKEYESEECELIDRYIPDQDVIELGGGIGYISLIIDTNISNDFQHIVIEPNKRLIPIIEDHKFLNNSSFKILNKAYSYDSKKVEVDIKESFESSSSYYVDNDDLEEIESITVKEIAKNFDIINFSLVIDIEGEEYSLIEKEIDFISNYCNFLVIEFHNVENENRYDKVLNLLEKENFRKLEKIESGKHNICVYRSSE